ncbi:MAG: tRNA uridine-5-carboxymethylaminomethyl(34) synthesis GTPase MnmE [Candidatus Marinimicrobia bacterium]|nr:tRNA uridine-5-carboxymethylaminomethyl(34) synthesis GTPase MnmE [Candidatus Neomarinimicrobiota bacterium]
MISADTIVAPSTPHGFGGLAVVRLSGNKSVDVVKKLIPSTVVSPLKNRYATTASVVAPSGEFFDEVVVTYFKNPASYTGEDIVEISCHGSPAVVASLLTYCVEYGCRMAEPGEFTRRAFLNGKMDLIQAESVASLIHSRSIDAAKLNTKLVRGALSNNLNLLRENLIKALSLIEYELDVSEEELSFDRIDEGRALLSSVKTSLDKLLFSYHDGRVISAGARVVITGKPNVGKSTLLNVLVGKNRAITNKTPGTTRDTVESHSVLGGVPVCFVDTAGLRDTPDPIETEGVGRSIIERDNADLVICLIDGLLYPIDNIDVKKLTVINKVDVLNKADLNIFLKEHSDVIPISALKEKNIQSLRGDILSKLLNKNFRSSDVYLTTKRQNVAIGACLGYVNQAEALWQSSGSEIELIAIELREALVSLDFLLGPTSVDVVLDEVFASFCVGK